MLERLYRMRARAVTRTRGAKRCRHPTKPHHIQRIALKKGDLKSAELYLNSARSALEKPGIGGHLLADNLYSLGNLARARGDSTKAETRYRQSVRIREKLAPDSISYAETLARWPVSNAIPWNWVRLQISMSRL